MAIYYERVDRGMQLLRDGLGPFVEAAVRTAVQNRKVRDEEVRRCAEDMGQAHRPIREWDVAALLKVMGDNWNEAFRTRRQASPERPRLGHAEQGLVSELRDWRNRWAHQERFTRTTRTGRWIPPSGCSRPLTHRRRKRWPTSSAGC